MPSRLRQYLRLLAFAALALPAGSPPCVADDLPPINSPASTDWFPGKYVWADLFTSDPAAATRFYSDLFDWTPTMIERNGRSYVVFENGGRPVAGVAVRPHWLNDQTRGRWVGYISVSDVASTAAKVTAHGGQILFGPRALAQRGEQAIVVDDQGVLIGLLHSSSGDPGEYAADPGDWVWAQTFVGDPAAAVGYFHDILGYEVTPDTRSNRPDAFLLSSGGYARGGLGPVPKRPGAQPGWLGFVRVTDLAATIAKVPSLGGAVLVAPKVRADSKLAVIADPSGASIGLIELIPEPGAP